MSGLLSRNVVQRSFLMYQVRNASHGYWNKDWKPGPIPTTKEEREAAAKKYNLLPHEYEPYTEENSYGIISGDYPKLPNVSDENKDIYYPWDIRDYRRNFGEAVHHDKIAYLEHKHDSHTFEKLRYPPYVMVLCLVSFVGFLASIKLLDAFRFFPPIAARQMPQDGVTHYGYNK